MRNTESYWFSFICFTPLSGRAPDIISSSMREAHSRHTSVKIAKAI